jgi:hypothetical protein
VLINVAVPGQVVLVEEEIALQLKDIRKEGVMG